MKRNAGRRAGWEAVRRQWRMGFIAYGLTTLASLPTALGVGYLMHDYFGRREVAAAVAAGFPIVELVEIIVETPRTFAALCTGVLFALLAWVTVQTFIAGAVLAGGRIDGPLRMRAALARGGEQFWGLLGLAVVGVPFVLVVQAVAVVGVLRLTSALTEGSISAATAIAVRGALAAVAALAIVWASSTHDLMRARRVDGAGLVGAVAGGIWTGMRRPFALLRRTMPWIMAAWILTAAVSLVDARWVWATPAAIVLGVAVQQGLVLLRAFCSVGALAAVQELVPVEPPK